MQHGLDPEDWTELRALGHRALDDMVGYMANVRDRPVWWNTPDAAREELRSPLPRRAVCSPAGRGRRMAAPSTTTIDGKLAILAAIVTHRTRAADLDAMVDAMLAMAARRSQDGA